MPCAEGSSSALDTDQIANELYALFRDRDDTWPEVDTLILDLIDAEAEEEDRDGADQETGHDLLEQVLEDHGWTLTAHGASRQVSSHADHPLVIKVCKNTDNEDEYVASRWLTLNELDLALPALWLSPGTFVLIMPRADLTLNEAYLSGHVSWQEQDAVLNCFEALGLPDVHPRNIGRWQDEWRMLDLGGCQADNLECVALNRPDRANLTVMPT